VGQIAEGFLVAVVSAGMMMMIVRAYSATKKAFDGNYGSLI
jgi:hypothetical protein